ncbi:hypothetical protein E4T56_gene10759 [Termitomyces sp. T112]|nr:hypothetical protein E4T56_gene10759 [Termitomyces sp. T112]
MANLASQLEKITMAHAFLNQVDHLLSMAHTSLVKDPCLAVTAIFQMWLPWFKTAGSGVEWPELANIEKECHQLYEQYKGEEWVCPYDVHFALVNLSLEFLLDNLMVGMTLFEDLLPNDQFFFQHLVGALVVVRGKEWSEGCGGKEKADCGDIQEGPSTPKAVTGSITRGLATSPRLATTPESKGKEKAQEEDDEDIEEQIEDTFSNKQLATLLCWQKASTMVTVLLEKQQEFKRMQGVCDNCWADNDPEGCWYPMGAQPCYHCNSMRKSCLHSRWLLRSTGSKFAKKIAALVRNAKAFVEQQRELKRRGEPIKVKPSSLHLPTSQGEAAIGGSRVVKGKSRELVESNEGDGNNGSDNDSDDDMPLGEEDVEMRETTSLATVAEVEQEASNMKVEGEEKFEAVLVAIKEDKEKDKGAEETRVQRWGPGVTCYCTRLAIMNWSGWARTWGRTAVPEGAGGSKRGVGGSKGVQEENNVGEGDWEEKDPGEVPDNNADLNA